jgi:YD repeat-containing protein
MNHHTRAHAQTEAISYDPRSRPSRITCTGGGTGHICGAPPRPFTPLLMTNETAMIQEIDRPRRRLFPGRIILSAPIVLQDFDSRQNFLLKN